jgi:hypothetical protein
MADIFQRRTLSGWIPADAESQAAWHKQKLGEVYRAKVAKPRNYKHHCLFMVLLETTFQNQEKFHNDQDFRRAVAYAAGHVREFMSMDGEVCRYPLPYDYEHLPDEDDFTKAFGAAMTVCAAIVRLTAPDLEEEIARYANEQYGIECPRIFRESYRERVA